MMFPTPRRGIAASHRRVAAGQFPLISFERMIGIDFWHCRAIPDTKRKLRGSRGCSLGLLPPLGERGGHPHNHLSAYEQRAEYYHFSSNPEN
jgi:hypothetical protein